MNLLKISRRLADSKTAMPIEKSNIPKEQIPEYVRLFEKLSLPVNLYKSTTNFVEKMTTELESIEEFQKHMKAEINKLQFDIDRRGRTHLMGVKYTDVAMIEDIQAAIDSLEPNMINIVTNISTISPLSQVSAKWLAHDMFHAIESNLDLSEIVQAVRKDLGISSLTVQECRDIFFYWLPDEFKQDAPGYMANAFIRDYIPDLMLHYLANNSSLPDEIQIQYKPVWAKQFIFKSKPDMEGDIAEYHPIPGANETQRRAREMLSRIYAEMTSELSSYIGKVFRIG